MLERSNCVLHPMHYSMVWENVNATGMRILSLQEQRKCMLFFCCCIFHKLLIVLVRVVLIPLSAQGGGGCCSRVCMFRIICAVFTHSMREMNLPNPSVEGGNGRKERV